MRAWLRQLFCRPHTPDLTYETCATFTNYFGDDDERTFWIVPIWTCTKCEKIVKIDWQDSEFPTHKKEEVV